MRKFILISFMLILVTWLMSCISDYDVEDNISLVQSFNDKEIDREVEKAINIFRHLYLPTEMSKLFENIPADFDSEMINSVNNADSYIISSDKALVMGVYGVDLGYVRMYERRQDAREYLFAIQTLSEYLGIPESYFTEALKRYDKPVMDKDSLTETANTIYLSTDKFLRENNQEKASALIILGGWIEAMHIAFSIADEMPSNIELLTRIAAQKSSLNSLIQLFSIYNDNQLISGYLERLYRIKEEFDGINIHFDEPYVNLDSLNKLISLNQYNAEINVEQLNELKHIIFETRDEIVN